MSIVEALPQKLTKLAGITLIRNTGNGEVEKEAADAGPSVRPRSSIDNSGEDHSGAEPFPEPHVNLTVIKDGRQKKSVPFNDFRKELDIEKERRRIREPALTKKRKPETEAITAIGEKRPKRNVAKKPAIVDSVKEKSPIEPSTRNININIR